MTPVAVIASLTFSLLILQWRFPGLARRDIALLGFNIAFLAVMMDMVSIFWLIGFLASGYVLAWASKTWRRVHPAFLVAPALLSFAVFKKYEFLPLQQFYAQIPDILGLSYVVFRVLNVVLDARESGRKPSLLSYLNYCISMFTFMSGPIQRYRAFKEDMERRATFVINEKEVYQALARIMGGALKVVFLAAWTHKIQGFFMDVYEQKTSVAVQDFFPSWLDAIDGFLPAFSFGLTAVFYLVFLYFTFSGYTDMVIGLGRLSGFRLPENFNYPFAANSFLDFWTRWHISLSLWFRDYCFTPILKYMVKAGIRNPVTATLPAYFISFGLLGLWHGRTFPFILCGLMFAAASTANHLYRVVLKNFLGKEKLAKINDSRIYQSLTASLSLLYISLSITGLWLPGDDFGAVWGSFSFAGDALSFCFLAILLSVNIYSGRWIWQQGRKIFLARRTGFVLERFNKPLYWGLLAGLCFWCAVLPRPMENPFIYFRF